MFGVAGRLACRGEVVRTDTHVITYALGEMIRALQLRKLQKSCETLQQSAAECMEAEACLSEAYLFQLS